MLVLEPAGVDWLTSDLEINDGVTTDSYNHTSVIADVATVMTALVAWATATFTPTFSWSWERDATTGGAILTLSADAAFTVEATESHAQTGYGLDPGVKASASSHRFDSPASGTWDPSMGPAVSRNIRVLGAGDACGNGAVRPGVPGLATNKPAIAAVGTAIDAGRFAAQVALASNPRRANVYQVHTATWLLLALGEVQREPVGLTHYRFDIEASGDAI